VVRKMRKMRKLANISKNIVNTFAAKAECRSAESHSEECLSLKCHFHALHSAMGHYILYNLDCHFGQKSFSSVSFC